MMRRATVYRRRKLIFVEASSKTEAGFWVASPPHLRLESDSSPEQVGEAVLEALTGSHAGLPTPNFRSGADPSRAVQQLAGVTSWDAFARDAVLVEIQHTRPQDSMVRLTPTEKHPGGSFEPLDGLSRQAPVSEPDELGRQVLAVLELCQ
jgi:hypothetical protein